uniref:Uncharacterized protein n=1 Tax=Sphaeramia orbicularis TaxID=375764 RepID=A0A673BWU8_9TELE
MEQRRLLLAVPEITLTLQPFELTEGGRGVLVQAVGDGLGLLRLTDQNSVTPKDHCHVLDLVPVDPGQDLGPTRVSSTCRSLSPALRHPQPPPRLVVLLPNGSRPKHYLSVQPCTEVSLYLRLL